MAARTAGLTAVSETAAPCALSIAVSMAITAAGTVSAGMGMRSAALGFSRAGIGIPPVSAGIRHHAASCGTIRRASSRGMRSALPVGGRLIRGVRQMGRGVPRVRCPKAVGLLRRSARGLPDSRPLFAGGSIPTHLPARIRRILFCGHPGRCRLTGMSLCRTLCRRLNAALRIPGRLYGCPGMLCGSARLFSAPLSGRSRHRYRLPRLFGHAAVIFTLQCYSFLHRSIVPQLPGTFRSS